MTVRTTRTTEARRCSRCGVRLARDNRQMVCAACTVSMRNVGVPPVVPPEFWQYPPLRTGLISWHMGRVIAAYRAHPWHGRVLPQEQVAGWLNLTQAQLSRIEHSGPPDELSKLMHWAQVLRIPPGLLWFKLPATTPAGQLAPVLIPTRPTPAAEVGDEQDALELARRVAASDVGSETLTQLETVFDDLAVAYPVTPPAELIERLRLHLRYVSKLLDGRATLKQHRRLITIGGWLSLLAATVHIDLKQRTAATTRLRTAANLAQHAGQDEIQAWCLETSAWRAVTEGNYPRAVELSQAAQAVAPAGSSALTQATAQEGRAQARLHQTTETYNAIERVHALVASRPAPDLPGHHYQYDPDKLTAYTATTLAWLGDPTAESYARDLLNKLTNGREGNGKWPRRIASAHLDLALTLLGMNRIDEAASEALIAISSGHVAPSNHWRATEVVAAVTKGDFPEARDLREAYEVLRNNQTAPSSDNSR